MYQVARTCQIKDLAKIYQSYFGYKTSGLFVEVGAFNCINWSNTRCLALAGWSGLLIEPQEQYFKDCQRLYKDNPKIKLEQCCVGSWNGITRLYLGGSISTTRKEMVDIYNTISWAKSSRLSKDNYIEVDIITLNNILHKHNFEPGFEVLVIDVEGAELDVLAQFDKDYWQPQMVIIEAHEQNEDKRLSSKAEAINRYFSNYDKIYSDQINNIYVR